ncbi:hypothetical protein [Paeniglutamicibacter terrestris]|uniref:Uncharacterized protein n=1 Tax=Paeniglutamicibacter terrestris TaxID=2723403 RepID=A0ABX1G9Z0_9MICC|nr:hypothetical protein [Paeniglutamicibacter terrestris]NKG22391.1 hypothetical protein [Paeniglutamicibacter terrestris]
MLDEVPWQALGVLTPSSLLGLAIWLILTGRLVAKCLYDVMVKVKEPWRSAAETQKETNAVQARTIEKQTMVGESVIKVMGAVQQARDGDPV